ncbi:MAG TPA: hypothetical protein PLU52_07340, partial [Opitutaceae bacterium]|nr:hypothetical protein [Opitutaceae bacterium]
MALPGHAQTVFTWTSGSIPTQTVGVLDTLDITTFADHAFNGQNVLNNGIVNWQAGYLRSGYNAVFTNSTSGTFNDSADSHLDNPFGGGYSFTFQNDGVYNKTGTGTTMVETYFNNTGTVSIQAGTFSLSGGGGSSGSAVFSAASGAYIIFTNSYTLGAGTTLTGAGSFQQTGGTLIIAGNLTASNLAFNGGSVGGSPILHGAGYLWNTGDWSTGSRTTTTIASDGVLTIATSSDHNFNYRDVINNGIVNWQDGYLRSGYNSAFTNSPGAIFNDSASSHVDNPYGGGYYFAFQNDGTYNKTATGTTHFDTPFYNTGTADIQSGTFSLNGGGSSNSTAVFNTSSGASVVFTNSYTLGDGTTLTGAGTFLHNGGTLVITSNLTASNLVFNGGSVGGSPILHGLGYLWNSGDWSTGSRTTTTIASDGVLTIATSSDHNFNYRDVINNGIVNWQDGYLRSGYNSAFTNSPGAIFNDSASSHVDNPYGGGYYFAFQNDGTYNKTATGTTHFDTPFYNTGTADIQSGTFSLNGGGSSNSTAVFNTSSGASVVFTNSYTLGDGTTLTGAGTFLHNGGTLVITSNVTASNLVFNGGTVGGSPILHGTGYLWNSGDWSSGTSTTGTIASDGVLTIATSNDHSFNYRNLVNNGVVNWQGGYLRSGYNATFTNSSTGTFNDTADSHLDNPFGGGYSFTFINDGLYVKSGAGTTYLDTYLNNNGTVNVQAGVLAVNGGGTNSAAGVFNTNISATTSFNSSYTLADGSELLGSGVYQFTNGTLSITGHLFADNLTFVGGTLGGSQTLHGAEYDWQGSDWSSGGSTTTTIASDGVLYVTTSNDHNFNYRNLTNHGVINWQGGALRSGYNATFTNAADGVINDTANSHIENPFGGGYTFTFVNN